MINSFRCWPSLEAYAKTLNSKRFSDLFYYDYNPPGRREKPAVILVHGLGDEADTWRHIIPLLGNAGYRVLAPDLPCFGRSVVPRRSSIKIQRDAVLELLNKEDKGEDFVLIGSSMGAVVAESVLLAEYNLRNKKPHREKHIKALVLLDGCFPIGSEDSSKLLLAALPFVGKKWYRSFRTQPEKAWKSLYSYYADIESLSEEDKRFLRQRVMDRVSSPTQERAYFSTLRSIIFQSLRLSYYRRLGSWPGKICLIWGEKDHILPKELNEPFIKLRKDMPTEFSVIQGAGHLPHQEKPDETVRVILSFLEKI